MVANGQRVKMMNDKPYEVWEPNLKCFRRTIYIQLDCFGIFDFQNGIAEGDHRFLLWVTDLEPRVTIGFGVKAQISD